MAGNAREAASTSLDKGIGSESAPQAVRAGRSIRSSAEIRASIDALRAEMRRHGIDAYIVPSADPHLSEYPPAHWLGRAWLSGFTGSAGTLVVTLDEAGVWADSRYWVQAEAQLAGSGIVLQRMISAQSASYASWLAETLPEGGAVGIDGALLGMSAAAALRDTLAARGVGLRTDLDLLAPIWAERPPLPVAPVYAHDAPFPGQSRTQKLALVRETLRAHQAQWHVVSTLDDLAWVGNLRGSDVSYNPVFLGFALIGLDTATLFVDVRKIDATLRAVLQDDGVQVADYDELGAALAALPTRSRVMLDPRRTTLGMAERVLAAGLTVVEAANPSTLAKACKLPSEAAHVRATMTQDGAALCEFFAWLDARLDAQRADPELTPIDELEIDRVLRSARARRPGYVCESFSTIAGFNANGAMPHYRATPEAFSAIAGDGLLLIDSGGQYLGGTTDITRVIPVGTPSAAQKRDFTVVLKGMIALSRARFPKGIRGPMLDAIARAPLWAEGMDFGHGTGHGVGYFLNVHEGPQVISHHANADASTAMLPGMITSIEPGVYRSGKWGVRIENLVMNRLVDEGEDEGEGQSGQANEFGTFMTFETLTLCPIDTRCIDYARLDDSERAWLNRYHAMVRERVAPLLAGEALAWLERRTAPIV